MAGARLDVELNSLAAQDAINQYVQVLGDPKPLFRDIGEFLIIAHNQRFRDQTSPDGTPWAPLSPGYLKTKRKNQNKILFLDGYLATTMRYQVGENELQFGSNLPYAAIHQFGGERSKAASMRTLYFKRDKEGGVGNKFVKKKKSDFAQDVQVGAYKIRMPARPFLGTSEEDNVEILNIVINHLERT